MTAPDAAVAARDPELPGLAALLDADAFAAEVAAANPRASVLGARAEYVRYKPGVSALVSYTLFTERGELLGYARAQRRDDRQKLEQVRALATEPGIAGAGGILIDRLGLAVYFFPNDRRIEGLTRLADPVPRAKLLARMAPERPDLHTAAIEPLRYKPERRFVAAIVSDGETRALVKAYDGGWKRAAAAVKHIESGGALRTPERLGRSRRRKLLLLEWLPGQSLSAQAQTGAAATLAGPSRRAGAALAELHARGGRRMSRPDVLERDALAAAAKAVAIWCPELEDRLARLCRRLAAEFAPARSAIIHGDFAADQVVAAPGGEVALVDLDEAAFGDPAADLASFAAAAERDVLLGRITAATRAVLADALAEGYEDACGRPGRAPPARIAASLVRLAPEPFRRREQRWPELTHALVERAEDLAGD